MPTARKARQPRRTRTDQLLATQNQILEYLRQDVEEWKKPANAPTASSGQPCKRSPQLASRLPQLARQQPGRVRYFVTFMLSPRAC
jgi:hypothetical protein